MRKLLILCSLLLAMITTSLAADSPKREFRGAWLHIIGQSQYQGKTTAQNKEYIRRQLDRLKEAGCNAVIFQVRPTADAMYESDIEPWTTWLTGKRGKAPADAWDPMEFTIREAHERGMEFHAWLNPYRVTSNAKEVLPIDHLSRKSPERFVKFNGQTFFDPAFPENREYICRVVEDITTRYDVDAIHIDDYFYPYPANGQKFQNDNLSYDRFGGNMSRNDWRRHNVDLLIEDLHKTIRKTKPWVRFGVSPFGIWRNKASDPRGSNSSGLQNYDDLYADVLLWADKGWVDYLAPQLYWTLDMKAAPSRHLAHWWNDNVNPKVQLYIGQDTKRTMDNPDPKSKRPNELGTKVELSRTLPNIKGNVWWHGYWVTDNYKGVHDSLALNYQHQPALPPAWGDKSRRPAPPAGLRIEEGADGVWLSWQPAPTVPGQPKALPAGVSPGHRPANVAHSEDVIRYGVYVFFPDEEADIDIPGTLTLLTPHHRVKVADSPEEARDLRFAVTALDRMNRESAPAYPK